MALNSTQKDALGFAFTLALGGACIATVFSLTLPTEGGKLSSEIENQKNRSIQEEIRECTSARGAPDVQIPFDLY